jgi:hypothetical protein
VDAALVGGKLAPVSVPVKEAELNDVARGPWNTLAETVFATAN